MKNNTVLLRKYRILLMDSIRYKGLKKYNVLAGSM